jgi:ABC-type dipeptide/oligopeptide/nickel transport system permease component
VAAVPAVPQGRLLQGDLGASFRYATGRVNDLVAKALPVSAAIGGSLLIAVLIGVAWAPWPRSPKQRGGPLCDADG